MSIVKPGEDIHAGMDYVAGELVAGRTGLWAGKGPAGFSLLVGGARPVDVAGGKILAVSLTESGLRKLAARIAELLGEPPPPARQVTLPEGLALGTKH